jgi:alkaline phosphatase
LGVAWAHGGHTGVDVTLYGWGKGSEQFKGHRQNSEVGNFIATQLGLDLGKVTQQLKANQTWVKEWVKPKAGKTVRRDLAMHHH